MKTLKVLLIVVSTTLVLLILGCEKKSPTESETDPAKAAERVDQANQILVPRIALILNSQAPDTAAFNLSAAKSLYEEALTYDPANLDAHFGVAVSEVITVFSDPTLIAAFSDSGMIVPPTTALDLFRSPSNVGDYLRRMNMGTSSKLHAVLRPGELLKTTQAELIQAGNPPSSYQNLVEANILPVFEDAIEHLELVAGNSSYVFLITPQLLGGGTTETYRIDLTEIYLLLAVLRETCATGSLAVSYNIDYDETDSAAVLQAWQINSPFLSLRTMGADHMKDARTHLLGMASSIKAGITFLMQEPAHVETDIIRYNPQDQAALQTAIMVTDTLRDLISGPYTFPDGPTVNLVNFFDTPIPNFKAKMPAYTVSAQPRGSGAYDAVLTWQANSFDAWIFPDPTMNGLFPGMTDAALKQTFGMTAAGWQKTAIVGG